MTTKAYVLVETAVGKNRDICTALRTIKGVEAAEVVTGPYDVIVTLSEESMSKLGTLVTGHIHTIPGVLHTVTCVVVYAHSG